MTIPGQPIAEGCLKQTPNPCLLYLRHRIHLLQFTHGFKLRPQLELLLFFFKVHQIPLILKPGLSLFPELQKQCDYSRRKHQGGAISRWTNKSCRTATLGDGGVAYSLEGLLF